MPTTKSPARTPCASRSSTRALESILGAFLRARQRRVSAGDDALHHLGSRCRRSADTRRRRARRAGPTCRRRRRTGGRRRGRSPRPRSIARRSARAAMRPRAARSWSSALMRSTISSGIARSMSARARIPALGEAGVDERHAGHGDWRENAERAAGYDCLSSPARLAKLRGRRRDTRKALGTHVRSTRLSCC